MKTVTHREATPNDLARIWAKDIAANPGDSRWTAWRNEYTGYNRDGLCQTFVVLSDGDPVGQGTLLFSPTCGAIRGRTALADGTRTANINALRIEKTFEGKGHISRMVHYMEQYAKNRGFHTLTIGVEAEQSRNLAIYLHWGYDRFITSATEEETLVLYYAKSMVP